MTVTYRFVVRPPSAFHCPEGFTAMRDAATYRRFDHGQVDYPQPLPRKEAEHWSLIPVGPTIRRLVAKDEDSGDTLVFGDADDLPISQAISADEEDLAYLVACGARKRHELEHAIRGRLADYGYSLTEIDWDDPS